MHSVDSSNSTSCMGKCFQTLFPNSILAVSTFAGGLILVIGGAILIEPYAPGIKFAYSYVFAHITTPLGGGITMGCAFLLSSFSLSIILYRACKKEEGQKESKSSSNPPAPPPAPAPASLPGKLNFRPRGGGLTLGTPQIVGQSSSDDFISAAHEKIKQFGNSLHPQDSDSEEEDVWDPSQTDDTTQTEISSYQAPSKKPSVQKKPPSPRPKNAITDKIAMYEQIIK